MRTIWMWIITMTVALLAGCAVDGGVEENTIEAQQADLWVGGETFRLCTASVSNPPGAPPAPVWAVPVPDNAVGGNNHKAKAITYWLYLRPGYTVTVDHIQCAGSGPLVEAAFADALINPPDGLEITDDAPWQCRGWANKRNAYGDNPYRWRTSHQFYSPPGDYAKATSNGISMIENGRTIPLDIYTYVIKDPKEDHTQCCELDDITENCEFTDVADPGLDLNASEWWRCAANATPAPVRQNPVYTLRESASFRSKKDDGAAARNVGRSFIRDGHHRDGDTAGQWSIRSPEGTNMECCSLGSEKEGDCDWTLAAGWKYWMCNGDFKTGKNCGWKGVGKRVNNWTATAAYVAACEDEYPDEGDLDYDTITCNGHDVDPSGFPLDPDHLDEWDPPIDVGAAETTWHCAGASDLEHGAVPLSWYGQRPTPQQAENSAMKFWTLALKYPDPVVGASCTDISP